MRLRASLEDARVRLAGVDLRRADGGVEVALRCRRAVHVGVAAAGGPPPEARGQPGQGGQGVGVQLDALALGVEDLERRLGQAGVVAGRAQQVADGFAADQAQVARSGMGGRITARRAAWDASASRARAARGARSSSQRRRVSSARSMVGHTG